MTADEIVFPENTVDARSVTASITGIRETTTAVISGVAAGNRVVVDKFNLHILISRQTYIYILLLFGIVY